MKLTQKAVAALTLPTGKTDVIHFDDEMSGFGYRLRIGAGGKIIALMGLPISPWRCHPSAAARFGRGARCRAGARPWPRRRWAVSPMARTRRPDKLDRRGKDRHTLKATVADYLAIKQREVRPRTSPR